MKTEAKVSVIMPVYNGQDFLNKSINSVLNQTFKEFNLILIDDCSTDNSLSICEEYSRLDERVIVCTTKQNKGSWIGNLDLYKHILADYVMCIDQDDWYEIDAIEKAYMTVVDDKTDIAIFDYYINENGKSKVELEELSLSNQEAISKLMADYEIKAYFWNKIYRKDLFIQGNLNWPYDYEVFEDFSAMPFIFENANRVKIISDKLYHYFQASENFSSRTPKNILNYYLSKSYWIRVDFLNEKYADMLSANNALNKAFSNTLGVWKNAVVNRDMLKKRYAERKLIENKELLEYTDIPALKKFIIRGIILLRRNVYE